MAQVGRREPAAKDRVKTSVAVAVAVAVAALVASGCAGGSGASGAGHESTTLTSGRAQDFTARDVQGRTVRLSDYLGKQVIVLDFGASWCQPCIAEIVHLVRMYERHRERGLVVLTIAMDAPDTVAEVPAWSRRQNITYPVLLDEDSKIASIYNPKKSAPLTVLIDRKGDIVYVHEGYNPGDEATLEQRVTKVLDERPSAK